MVDSALWLVRSPVNQTPGEGSIASLWMFNVCCCMQFMLSLRYHMKNSSILFYSILFYSILFYSILFYSPHYKDTIVYSMSKLSKEVGSKYKSCMSNWQLSTKFGIWTWMIYFCVSLLLPIYSMGFPVCVKWLTCRKHHKVFCLAEEQIWLWYGFFIFHEGNC